MHNIYSKMSSHFQLGMLAYASNQKLESGKAWKQGYPCIKQHFGGLNVVTQQAMP